MNIERLKHLVLGIADHDDCMEAQRILSDAKSYGELAAQSQKRLERIREFEIKLTPLVGTLDQAAPPVKLVDAIEAVIIGLDVIATNLKTRVGELTKQIAEEQHDHAQMENALARARIKAQTDLEEFKEALKWERVAFEDRRKRLEAAELSRDTGNTKVATLTAQVIELKEVLKDTWAPTGSAEDGNLMRWWWRKDTYDRLKQKAEDALNKGTVYER